MTGITDAERSPLKAGTCCHGRRHVIMSPTSLSTGDPRFLQSLCSGRINHFPSGGKFPFRVPGNAYVKSRTDQQEPSQLLWNSSVNESFQL